MSIRLRVSLPARPLMKNRPQRKVYRVVFLSGREIPLTALARQLDIPYSTVVSRLFDAGLLSVGTHGDTFMKVLASLRAKRKLSHRAKTHPCPTCHGKGRIPNDEPDR